MPGQEAVRWALLGTILLLFSTCRAMGQSSPPGMGSGHAATWFAVGVEQHLDTLKKKHWVGYVGLGRKGYPDSYLPYQRAATVVVDQEFHHHFHRHWKYSLALSFREHDEYRASAPYDHATPGRNGSSGPNEQHY